MKQWRSEGDGAFTQDQLGSCGQNVVIEDGVRIFHPANVHIGDNVYIGHDTIIKGYYKHDIVIGSNVWIGQFCFIHGAGGVRIGENTGIGPSVRIHASYHKDTGEATDSILFAPLAFSPIIIEENCNIGIAAVILNGVTVGAHSKVGANSVVNRSIPPFSVAVGVPARVIKDRRANSTTPTD